MLNELIKKMATSAQKERCGSRGVMDESSLAEAVTVHCPGAGARIPSRRPPLGALLPARSTQTRTGPFLGSDGGQEGICKEGEVLLIYTGFPTKLPVTQ